MNDEEMISNNFTWFDGSMNYAGKKVKGARRVAPHANSLGSRKCISKIKKLQDA
jgi:hypothetical protein